MLSFRACEDLANQIRYSKEYKSAILAAGKSPGRFLAPAAAEYLSGAKPQTMWNKFVSDWISPMLRIFNMRLCGHKSLLSDVEDCHSVGRCLLLARLTKRRWTHNGHRPCVNPHMSQFPSTCFQSAWKGSCPMPSISLFTGVAGLDLALRRPQSVSSQSFKSYSWVLGLLQLSHCAWTLLPIMADGWFWPNFGQRCTTRAMQKSEKPLYNCNIL